MEQINEIIKIIKARTGPIIFAGDFNEKDPSTFNELMEKTSLKQIFTAKTFPSWKPDRSLDYVLLSHDFKVNEVYAQKQPAFSDHLSLIVKAELN